MCGVEHTDATHAAIVVVVVVVVARVTFAHAHAQSASPIKKHSFGDLCGSTINYSSLK